MQQFLYKLRMKVVTFMQGRYGPDRLCLFLVWASLIVNVLAVMIGTFPISLILNLLSYAGWIWSIWRMLSKNRTKRAAENQWFLTRFAKVKTPIMQAVARFKNRKKYVYFSCPKCGMKLRLPRGVGNVTVKCSKCGHAFDKKA